MRQFELNAAEVSTVSFGLLVSTNSQCQ